MLELYNRLLLCWFVHEKTMVNMTCSNLTCNACDLTFQKRPEFLKHRKALHIDAVTKCRNKMNGACQYGDTKCWFKHSKEKYDKKEKSEQENMEHNEVVEKVIERLAKLEKSNQILTNSANEG